MPILYKLTFKSGKSYIGLTSKCLEERCKGHIYGSRNKNKTAVADAIRKYGEDFKREVLLIGSIDYVKEMEVKAIAAFNTLAPNGYNLSLGGDVSPMTIPEIAAKTGVSRKGRKNSKETREKISAALKGRKNPAHSLKLKGRKASQETKLKMSKSALSYKKTDQHIAKIRENAAKARAVHAENIKAKKEMQ